VMVAGIRHWPTGFQTVLSESSNCDRFRPISSKFGGTDQIPAPVEFWPASPESGRLNSGNTGHIPVNGRNPVGNSRFSAIHQNLVTVARFRQLWYIPTSWNLG